MNYCGITAPDIANGNGCRVVLWVSGCSHHCKGCHNPETWDYKYGNEFNNDAINKIYFWLNKEYISGLTISGGDPLTQNEEGLITILDLVTRIKSDFPDKNIWLYTGYKYEYFYNDVDNKKLLCQQIIDKCDILVDGSYKEELRDLSLPFRGSSNQRIIELHK